MNAPHPTFANALAGFKATVPANLPKTVKPSEAELLGEIRAEADRYENAVQALLATAETIRDSMSVVDQPSLHKRLTQDIARMRAFHQECAA